jgi:hypothetical protein
MIILTFNADGFRPVFAQMDLKAVVVNELAMPFDTTLGVYVCKWLTMPKDSLWNHVKSY